MAKLVKKTNQQKRMLKHRQARPRTILLCGQMELVKEMELPLHEQDMVYILDQTIQGMQPVVE
jgi:hypothetical protein